MTMNLYTIYPNSDGSLYAPGPGDRARILVSSLFARVNTVDLVSTNFEQ